MLNITLNREVRNAVNALVRGHKDFENFRLTNGAFDSRMMTKDLTLRAVEQFGLEQTVLDMVAKADAATPAATPASDMVTPASDMAASVLDPLRPFLSATLLDTVTNALAPIVALAEKPPVEIVRTVTLDTEGHPMALVHNDARKVGASTLGKLFGIARHKHSAIPVSLWDAENAPRVDPFFVPEPTMLAKIVSAIDPVSPRMPRNVWLAGPAGSGKTSLPEQIAARAKRPFVRIAFQRAIEPTDLIGMLGLDGKGGMAWRDGVLTKAIRKPGTIVLLDEITFAPAGLLAVIQTLLDTRHLTLPTGEVVACADGVVFVAADNTKGYGDESGLYAGTTQANAALVDRMARLVVVDYLPAALESQALANHTGAPRAACDMVVAFVNSARKLAGFDGRPLSLRRSVAFVEMVNDGFSVSEAFDDTVLSRLPDAEKTALYTHFKASFDAVTFARELSPANTPKPDATSSAPEQMGARNAFDAIDG